MSSRDKERLDHLRSSTRILKSYPFYPSSLPQKRFGYKVSKKGKQRTTLNPAVQLALKVASARKQWIPIRGRTVASSSLVRMRRAFIYLFTYLFLTEDWLLCFTSPEKQYKREGSIRQNEMGNKPTEARACQRPIDGHGVPVEASLTFHGVWRATKRPSTLLTRRKRSPRQVEHK